MSSVKEHNNSTLLSMDGKLNPEPQVGDMVRNFYQFKQIGIVIELIDKVQSKVLWGEYTNPWESFVRPLTKNYIQISSDMFPVQPMPASALPFYLNHRNKDSKKTS